MKRSTAIVTVLLAVIFLLLANIAITVKNSRDIQRHFTVVCSEHRALATITKERVGEEIEGLKLLPGVSIPGLTNQKLRERTEQKLHHEQKHLLTLESIRKATC